MNSDYTVFDQIIMDPNLTKTVPKNQFFYTGMDAYIHCVEALNGSYRNAIGDAYSEQTISQCRDVFMSDDMMSDENRSKLMVASYLGGCAIATSYVGVVHPFSAGLSVVLGTHHCVANCITMRAMEEFYPTEYNEFWKMVDKQGIVVPEGICKDLSDEQYDQLYASTVIHEKPLTNALGENFKDILTKEKVIRVYLKGCNWRVSFCRTEQNRTEQLPETARYSMPVFMRLCQYFNHNGGRFNLLLSSIFARMNQVNNNFEHGVNPKVAVGVVFHHTGVCITSGTLIDKGVHIYRNVTFGSKHGKAPHVKKYAKIASHSIVLGGVTVGERSIVAPGAVVVKDVPNDKIVAGVPAAVIGDGTDDNYNF